MEPAKHYILFTLADTTYAVRSNEVQQMDMVGQITPVPNAPSAVEGVVFLRGEVIPAVDLRVRFGFPKRPYDLKTRLIVVREGSRSVGLIVDTSREFVSIPEEAVKPPPEGISRLSGQYLAGIATVGERLVLLLNCSEVINPADMAAAAPKGAQTEEGKEHEK